jgi:hypothetical protein
MDGYGPRIHISFLSLNSCILLLLILLVLRFLSIHLPSRCLQSLILRERLIKKHPGDHLM